MAKLRTLALLALLGAIAFAQEEPAPAAEEAGDDETSIEIGGEGGTQVPDLVIDPFEEEEEPVEEPNRPDPVVIGEWQPPPLDDGARRELDALLGERGRRADDADVRYQLAEFYLSHGWIPQAESEFFSAARLDPDSIRPWEGLLRVYAWEPGTDLREVEIVLAPGMPPQLQRQLLEELGRRGEDWLPSDLERARRITRAHEEILKRRPDDVARRRELIAHLQRLSLIHI